MNTYRHGRYRAWRVRRMMRWAMRHRHEWKVLFWIDYRRKERRPPDWPVIEVADVYAYGEADASP